MNKLTENKEKMDVIELTDSGLANLYLGNKFAQWLCLEINQTANIAWDNLVKDYRLSLNSICNQETASSFDEVTVVNLQEQLLNLSDIYLDTLSIKINSLFTHIKNFTTKYATYHKFFIQTVENSEDGKYKKVLYLLKNSIKYNKDLATDCCKDIDVLLKEVNKNYQDLNEKENICRTYLAAFQKNIDNILKKIDVINEEIKQKNIQQIEKSYEENFSLTFYVQNSDVENNDNNEINKEEELERLKQELKKYNQEYSILVGLVYLAKQFNAAGHTIKLGVNMVLHAWEELEEYFCSIDLQLQEKDKDAVRPILESLGSMQTDFKALETKIGKLEKELTMTVASSYNNEQPISVIGSSLLKLVCQN